MELNLNINVKTVEEAQEIIGFLLDRTGHPSVKPETQPEPKLVRRSKEPPFAEPVKPTPLETAIDEKKAEQDAEPAEDSPLDALTAHMEPAAIEAAETAAKVEEPKKRTRKTKTEAAPEPEQPEDKPLTIDAIRKASKIALELIGAPVIQEALAKFHAVDQKDQALRMSALPEKDYARYIEFLKKKANDAAKEWPAS